MASLFSLAVNLAPIHARIANSVWRSISKMKWILTGKNLLTILINGILIVRLMKILHLLTYTLLMR